MKRHELGIGLQGDLAPGSYTALGRLAEELGFDVVTVFGDAGYLPPMVPLAEIARATHTVRLGPSCLNPYTLHPAEIAAQVAALDVLSGGRAYLGLARGAWLEELGLTQPRPLTTLREAAGVIRALHAGGAEGYAGTVFAIRPGHRLRFPVLRSGIPLLLGAWGARAQALAGEIADELKVGGSANPDLVPLVIDRVRRGAAGVSRSPEAVRIVFGAVTVVDEDGARARAAARSAVAMYFDVVARLDPTLDVSPAVLGTVADHLRAGDRRAAGESIPDGLLDRFAFSGTPRDVARQARALLDAGVDRVEFGAPFGLDPAAGLQLLGRRVRGELF